VPTASSRADRAPSEAEAALLLDLADQILGRFRPHVLWTYGGHPVTAEVMRRARVRGIPSVFHLHNFAYPHRAAFAEAAAVLVPSAFSQQYHARKLGLCCTALPPPLPAPPPAGDAPAPMTRYVTFVNPEPIKGVTVFARIAAELECRRPDIPLLVVEGRGGMNWLERVPLDLSGLTNLHRMPSTPDPDRFYRASRLVLVPSLCRESFGRVAAEALQRGLPVLASDRGALPETLGDAGFLFALPDRCTPRTPAVPSAREVAPWVATIERIWDDPAFEAEHQARARNEASRWDRDIIYMRYEDFLYNLAIIRKK
jgi:glycosyltransferase involved in cell wall biosynthesis